MEDLAGHEAGCVTSEEHVAFRALPGLAGASHGNVGTKLFHFLSRKGRWDQWRPDGPRGYGIDADAFFREVSGERTGEADDRSFRRRIVQEARAAAVGGDRGRVDDGGALGFLQMWQRGGGHEEHVENIRGERPRELLLVDVFDGVLGVLLSGVVDENVELSEFREGLGNGLLALGLPSDVAFEEKALAAFFLHEGFGFLGVLFLLQINDRDVCSLPCESNRCGTANPGIASGDERYLAFQPVASFEGRILVFWRGIHLIFPPRLARLCLSGALLFGGVLLGVVCHGARN